MMMKMKIQNIPLNFLQVSLEKQERRVVHCQYQGKVQTLLQVHNHLNTMKLVLRVHLHLKNMQRDLPKEHHPKRVKKIPKRQFPLRKIQHKSPQKKGSLVQYRKSLNQKVSPRWWSRILQRDPIEKIMVTST